MSFKNGSIIAVQTAHTSLKLRNKHILCQYSLPDCGN